MVLWLWIDDVWTPILFFTKATIFGYQPYNHVSSVFTHTFPVTQTSLGVCRLRHNCVFVDRISGERIAIGRVRPYVFALPFVTTDLWGFDLTFFACKWLVSMARRGLKVKVIGEGQKSMKTCVLTSTYCGGVLWVLIDSCSSRFAS